MAAEEDTPSIIASEEELERYSTADKHEPRLPFERAGAFLRWLRYIPPHPRIPPGVGDILATIRARDKFEPSS